MAKALVTMDSEWMYELKDEFVETVDGTTTFKKWPKTIKLEIEKKLVVSSDLLTFEDAKKVNEYYQAQLIDPTQDNVKYSTSDAKHYLIITKSLRVVAQRFCTTTKQEGGVTGESLVSSHARKSKKVAIARINGKTVGASESRMIIEKETAFELNFLHTKYREALVVSEKIYDAVKDCLHVDIPVLIDSALGAGDAYLLLSAVFHKHGDYVKSQVSLAELVCRDDSQPTEERPIKKGEMQEICQFLFGSPDLDGIVQLKKTRPLRMVPLGRPEDCDMVTLGTEDDARAQENVKLYADFCKRGGLHVMALVHVSPDDASHWFEHPADSYTRIRHGWLCVEEEQLGSAVGSPTFLEVGATDTSTFAIAESVTTETPTSVSDVGSRVEGGSAQMTSTSSKAVSTRDLSKHKQMRWERQMNETLTGGVLKFPANIFGPQKKFNTLKLLLQELTIVIHGREQVFVVLLYPRGESNWKNSEGRGNLHLKRKSESSEDELLKCAITVRVGTDTKRVEHTFAKQTPLCKIESKDGEFDIRAASSSGPEPGQDSFFVHMNFELVS